MLYNEKLVNTIKDILISKKQTIAVAESVTAGHLQAAFSSAVEASKFFQGGITTYNLGQKCRHLDIDPIQAEEVNCVAEKVAVQMAMSAARLFCSDYAIAITGYATRMPEKGINDLFAYFAIVFNGKLLLSQKITTTKERVDAQVDYTWQVIGKMAEQVSK